MRKLWVFLAAVTLAGCGDDLGWEQKDLAPQNDCALHPDQEDSDACVPCQDVTETDIPVVDVQDVPEDVTATNLNDTESTDIDDVSISTDTSDPPEDSTVTEDSMPDAEEEDSSDTGDVIPPPECVTATDCVAITIQCAAADCQEGKCVTISTSAFCDDGNACTQNDACSNLVCSGLPVFCDDGEICTDDMCDSVTGCVGLANVTTCTDGDDCTVNDICDQGTCKSGDLMSCLSDECVVSSCVSGVCVDDVAALDNVLCTDGNPCTAESRCLDGKCLQVLDKSCDDGNSCTADSCDSTKGCDNQPLVDVLCEDGNSCTESDTCIDGSCTAGAASVCDDENLCTLDSCDPALGCVYQNVPDGDSCVVGICNDGACSCPSGFGCAAPKFSYVNDVNAGMIGGMGGSVGPKMGCIETDVLIGLGFDFSTGTKTATRTTAICGKVTVDEDGVVSTQQTNTLKSGGAGCYGWDPSVATPLTICPSGWAVVGLKALQPGGTLFSSVIIVCGKLGTSGAWSGEAQDLVVPGMPGTGSPQEISCPPNSIARYFETRAGCGQDALTMYCAIPVPDCSGQDLICKDVL